MPRRNISNGGVSLTSGNLIAKLVFIISQLVQAVKAIPLAVRSGAVSTALNASKHQEVPMTREEFYINMFTSVFLVLAGGVFAGLTLGLMGQDEVYLKVIATSGEPDERKHARKVLRLIGRGKHWVLVTLLLCNVITNETLPIVLDNCLGGGWPAVVASTASIVVFGEIIPQSICVRYGLQVGSMFAPFVLVLMYVMYPIAYPCSLLLDYILGEDHGTVYKKSGLKTLVTLHRTMGSLGERLNDDEVTIISAVLDLKEKSVADIMTPIDRVYTMSSDTILNEKTVEEIFNAGFSRIPIHLPNEPLNFIGMLLVRVLISYDPEDALPVSSFPLATLPETNQETSCLNILNYFQEGKSHMIVVSDHPGEPYGALGVLTLEDVIEELIGEEIVDESDVYIDINNNIKRTAPGPLSKRNITSYLHNLYQISASNSKRNSLDEGTKLKDGPTSPLRNNVVGANLAKVMSNERSMIPQSPNFGPVDAKHWKPKNPASNPLETNKSFVKIKKPTTFDNVMPPPNRPAPDGSNGYGAIHATEAGALREAQELHKSNGHGHHGPDESATSQKFLQNDKKNSNEANGYHDNSITIPHTDYTESRSYRTGGIIESVVNVQGVHKTIIENVSEDEEGGETFSLLSGYRKENDRSR
ncbi:protein Mam3p [[Candida] railenensis]|uniref:Protein Mam3p n=1 Tax=[Candida] railenensis TaxID=45579 RepID=A0A9P0QME0_9ASCO|nr:protein Mam3p [[Candida] railenensis]